MPTSLNYSYQEKRLPFFVRAIKYRFYERFTRGATPVFLKGGDSISTSPIVAGLYERELVALLEASARAGCDRALIDIGANIGLTTFYAGENFKESFCFEPNPKVFCVLKANLFERLERGVHLFNFGLGARDERTTLNIPKANYGGAFVLGQGNAYTLEELASKDGFGKFEKSNYDELPIEVRKGREVLAPIFEKVKGGFTIKIDVEGYETTVLEEIAAAMPKDAKFAIVFENWSQSFKPQSVSADLFKRPVKLYKLATAINPRSSKITKILNLLMRGRRYSLSENPDSWIGTLLITDESLKVN